MLLFERIGELTGVTWWVILTGIPCLGLMVVGRLLISSLNGWRKPTERSGLGPDFFDDFPARLREAERNAERDAERSSQFAYADRFCVLYCLAVVAPACIAFFIPSVGRVLNGTGIEGRVILFGSVLVPFLTFLIWFSCVKAETEPEPRFVGTPRQRTLVKAAIIGSGCVALVLALGAAVPEYGHWLSASECVLGVAFCLALAHTRRARCSVRFLRALTVLLVLLAGWRLATPLSEKQIALNRLFVMVGGYGGDVSVSFSFLADHRLAQGDVAPLLTELRKLPDLERVRGPRESELPIGFLDDLFEGLNKPNRGAMEPFVRVEDAGGARARRQWQEGLRRK